MFRKLLVDYPDLGRLRDVRLARAPLTFCGDLTPFLCSLNNLWLVAALVFLVGGFSLINKYGKRKLYDDHRSGLSSFVLTPAPLHATGADPLQFGDQTITQKTLYTGLFVIGIPLLLWASPLGTFFWLVGASSIIILGHATVMEPGVESEYAQVDGGV